MFLSPLPGASFDVSLRGLSKRLEDCPLIVARNARGKRRPGLRMNAADAHCDRRITVAALSLCLLEAQNWPISGSRRSTSTVFSRRSQ